MDNQRGTPSKGLCFKDNSMVSKVIVDVDTGIDDATALMLLLSRSDVEVVAITCVRGNVDVENVCINTLRVLKACGKSGVPVFKGADRPLLDCESVASHFHGEDGLGDTTWSAAEAVDTKDIQPEHAVMATLRLVNQYPGEITLIPLGPLTNIALALRLDPTFGSKLKEVFIMGGNIEGRGNSTVSSEFNFHVDPEAAYVCFTSFTHLIHLIPWEVCLDTQNRIPWKYYDDWIRKDTPKSRFFKKITEHWVEKIKVREQPGFKSCDLFAMVAVLDRSSILEQESVYATVELHGQLTRGQMVVDWRNRMQNEPTVIIIKKICTDKIVKLFSSALD